MQTDQSQFEKLYRDYHIMVYNVALNYLQNIEDAEEITQDVFIKAYSGIARFNHKATLKTWIYRITINQCLDFIKKKNSRKHFFVFGKKSKSDTGTLSNFEHPGIILEKKEDAAILFAAINSLTENQKTAFILSKLDGLSNPEISEIMALSISSVESLIFRAKTALREKLSEKFKNHRKN